MILFHWISGSLLGLAWFSRVVDAAFGMPKVADITRPEFNRRPATAEGDPRVSIVVPACNEEGTIERCLKQLLKLDYSDYEIIAVDDRSTDRTGPLMDQVAASAAAAGRLRIIHIRELPARWLGKTHAMWTAAKEATGDWILFTDADVFFRPDALRRAVTYAEKEKADHVVLFPYLIMHGAGEHMMIAFFQSLFVFGHRPWKVADPKTKDHIGVGAFNLIRRRVYEQIGTYERLRLEVLDDMKLGKVVKFGGFRQRNVFGRDLISIRWARGAMGVVRNLTKNFFSVMAFQWPRALGAIAVLGFLNLMPFLGVWLARGASRIPYIVALSSMFLIYAGMSWRSRIPPYYFFLHPISTALFAYTMLRSMSLTLWNGGVEWRGTKYPLEELRKGLV